MSVTLALALLVAAGALFAYLIKPAYQELQQVRSEEISRRAFVEEQQEAIGAVRDLIDSYAEAGTLQASVSAALPQGPDFSGAVSQMNGIAAANGVTLNSISVSAPAAQTRPAGRTASTTQASLQRPVTPVSLQVRITAPYQGLRRFVESLETNLRVSDIQSLGISPAGNPTQNLYNADLTVVTYYQQPN